MIVDRLANGPLRKYDRRMPARRLATPTVVRDSPTEPAGAGVTTAPASSTNPRPAYTRRQPMRPPSARPSSSRSLTRSRVSSRPTGCSDASESTARLTSATPRRARTDQPTPIAAILDPITSVAGGCHRHTRAVTATCRANDHPGQRAVGHDEVEVDVDVHQPAEPLPEGDGAGPRRGEAALARDAALSGATLLPAWS